MRDPAERTLTAVQSPLSPGEQKDRAVPLVVGSADAPALPARTRLQIVGDDLFVGRRADGVPNGANAATHTAPNTRSDSSAAHASACGPPPEMPMTAN